MTSTPIPQPDDGPADDAGQLSGGRPSIRDADPSDVPITDARRPDDN